MKYIDYDAIRENFEYVKGIKDKKIMAVLKNNAYHGDLIKVIEALLPAGLDYVMVTEIYSAMRAQNVFKDKVRILVANPLVDFEFEMIKDYDFDLIIDSYEYLVKNYEHLSKYNLHLKVNTGMNRFGISDVDEIMKVSDFLLENNKRLHGLFTHFYLEDEDEELFNKCIDDFTDVYRILNPLHNMEVVHCENSVTTLKRLDYLDFCNYRRFGRLLYGDNMTNLQFNGKPCFYVYGKVIKKFKMKKGERISYGLNNVVDRDCTVAVTDFGYGEGIMLDRAKYPAHINSKAYDIITFSFSHSYIIVDDEVEVGDRVDFYGEEFTVSQHANDLKVASAMLTTYMV